MDCLYASVNIIITSCVMAYVAVYKLLLLLLLLLLMSMFWYLTMFLQRVGKAWPQVSRCVDEWVLGSAAQVFSSY